MKYIKDASKLAEVTRILASHMDDEKQFYSAQLSIQISREDDSLIKIGNLFAVANREQRGASTARLLEAFNSFGESFDDIIKKIEGLDAEKSHLEFLKWLCGSKVSRTNQKTANLFLKWIVMFNNTYDFDILDWSTWKPYLHVPLDVWVTRLLGRRYLDVGTTDYEHDFLRDTVPNMTYGTNKYLQLQSELGEVTSKVNQHRIVLDELWMVGYLFCNYRNILCDRCWIAEHCTNPIKPI